jgi:hypothetical protein
VRVVPHPSGLTERHARLDDRGVVDEHPRTVASRVRRGDVPVRSSPGPARTTLVQ